MSDVNLPASELGITPKDMGIKPSESGMEVLFGRSFEIKKLENGKPIPIGGSNRFADDLSGQDLTTVTGDFDHFRPLFQTMHDRVIQDTPIYQQWLEKSQIPFNPRLLATLISFSNGLEWKYPNFSINKDARLSIREQTENGNPVNLSDVFENKSAECAEVAALAQFFLQEEGIDSSYFSGELLWNKEHDSAESHTFIVLREKDRQYVFDPSFTIKRNNSIYPSIYALKGNFDAEVRKGEKRFVKDTNILTNKEAYFGVGDGTNVSPGSIAP